MIGQLVLKHREVDDRAEYSDPLGSEHSDTDTDPQSSRRTASEHVRRTSREKPSNDSWDHIHRGC